MAGPLPCECGAVLLDDVSEKGVLFVGSTERMMFRRVTDHVVCDRCMRSYAVRDLIGRSPSAEITEQVELLLLRIERARARG